MLFLLFFLFYSHATIVSMLEKRCVYNARWLFWKTGAEFSSPLFFYSFNQLFQSQVINCVCKGWKAPEGFAFKLFLWARNMPWPLYCKTKGDASKNCMQLCALFFFSIVSSIEQEHGFNWQKRERKLVKTPQQKVKVDIGGTLNNFNGPP